MFESVRLITLSSHSTYHSDQKCNRKTKKKNAQLGNLTIGLVIEYSQGTCFPRLLDIACKDNAKEKYRRIRARTPVLVSRGLSSFTVRSHSDQRALFTRHFRMAFFLVFFVIECSFSTASIVSRILYWPNVVSNSSLLTISKRFFIKKTHKIRI